MSTYSPIQAISGYWLAILVSAVASASLSILGCHLAARDRSVQTLCVTQGSMFGVLVCLGIGGFFAESFFTTSALPLIGAFLFANLTYVLSEKLITGKTASKNTLLIALFASLVAFSHLASALFPSLESHMSQKFFGDLATMSGGELYVAGGVSLGVAAVLMYRWKTLSCESFDLALFGKSGSFGGKTIDPRLFQLLSFILICLCVQTMGFLFTAGSLFIPTTMISLGKLQGLWRHYVYAIIISVMATVLGFTLSVVNGHLPTVPTIIFIMSVGGWVLLKFMKTQKVPA